MTWDPISQPIDYYKLAGQQSPGISVVAGQGPPQDWDERRGYGLSGMTLVYLGNGLAKFGIETRLYTSEEYQQYVAFAKLLKAPRPGVRPKALDIWHPFLEEHEIRSVVVLQPTLPTELEPGVWAVTTQFEQFRRPKISLAKPEASAATPTDPVDQYIDDLTGQLQALAGPPPQQ